jgi:hypothetical protein
MKIHILVCDVVLNDDQIAGADTGLADYWSTEAMRANWLELGTVVRDFTGWVADSSAIQFCSKGLVKLDAPLDSELQGQLRFRLGITTVT